MARRLTLRKETVVELTTDDLTVVVAGAPITQPNCNSLVCLTEPCYTWRHCGTANGCLQ